MHILNIAYITLFPLIAPVITYMQGDKNRLGFILWPFIYLFIGMFLEKPKRYKESGNLSYNLKIGSLAFLFFFEVIANCLAPLHQRAIIASFFYLPYVALSLIVFQMKRRIKTECEQQHATGDY